MHKKFIDKWCESFDRIYDDVGEEAALAMVRDVLAAEDWELVRTRFPEYLREKRQNERHTS